MLNPLANISGRTMSAAGFRRHVRQQLSNLRVIRLPLFPRDIKLNSATAFPDLCPRPLLHAIAADITIATAMITAAITIATAMLFRSANRVCTSIFGQTQSKTL